MNVLAYRTKVAPFAVALALGLAIALAGCAQPEGDNDSTTGDPPAAGQGDQAAQTLTVNSPGDGDTVTVPFEVSVDSSVELGSIDEQLHHLHIWFGDTSGQPLIIESDTATIDTAPDGETTMIVQVHTFDHQPASDQVSVPLVVQGGGNGEDPGYSPPGGNDY